MTSGWKNILIFISSTVRDALQILDSEALRIVLVVDEKTSLLGVITDGDIRRGILNGVSLDDSVVNVMNDTPTVASSLAKKDDLLLLMEELDILTIPLVNENGIVVGLQTLRETLLPAVHNNPVFIMAGGFGTRLKPLTDNCPKPMLKVGTRPILETLILNFKNSGFHDFYISTHYMPEVIRDYFGDGSSHNISITYVHEENPLGTGGALGLLPKSIAKLPIILMNGDVLTAIDFEKLLDFHNSNLPIATMCVREYEYQVPYGVIEGSGSLITGMVEKPVQRFFINAGVYVLSQAILENVIRNERIDMPTLLENQITIGETVMKFPIHEYWLDIGRIDDFNRAQLDIEGLGL